MGCGENELVYIIKKVVGKGMQKGYDSDGMGGYMGVLREFMEEIVVDSLSGDC